MTTRLVKRHFQTLFTVRTLVAFVVSSTHVRSAQPGESFVRNVAIASTSIGSQDHGTSVPSKVEFTLPGTSEVEVFTANGTVDFFVRVVSSLNFSPSLRFKQQVKRAEGFKYELTFPGTVVRVENRSVFVLVFGRLYVYERVQPCALVSVRFVREET